MSSRMIFMNVVFVVFVGVFCAHAETYQQYKQKLPEWLELGGEVRHRFEDRRDFDLNSSVEDNGSLHLWRTRLNVGLKPTDGVKFFYQLQDSRISHDSLTGSKTTYENWMDHRQLWAEFQQNEVKENAVGLTEMGLRVGRQELSYGAQRLIGAFGWSNVTQTFDAAKLVLGFKEKNLHLDIFGGGKTPVKSPREEDDFYSGDDNDRLWGYYATYTGVKQVTIEQYLINRDTEGKTVSFGQVGDGAVNDYTIGVRALGKIGDSAWDFEVDSTYQFGDSGSLDVNAWMLVGILGYTFDHGWKPRLAFEYDYASGDSDPTDGKRETFDNLYPTNHSFYGFIDFVSLQNIHDYRLQLKASPLKMLSLQADYHVFYLDTSKDNLYAASRSVKRTSVAGADDFVGTELDALATYKLNDYLSFMGGYSHFFAGDFLEDTGASDDSDFVYLQTTLSF